MNLRMPEMLREHYKKEMLGYQLSLIGGDLASAWTHLERSHILGHEYPFEHTCSHWQMLKFGVKNRDLREVLGQLPRLLVGGIKSFSGVIPRGNTGGANVSALKPMPVPAELKLILDNSKKYPHVRS
ncbi:hypothetical protein GCM10023115_28020 [Pontixanthobacter gangjinensis]|uniref:DUF3703 domain-containing protein n=1 Tax=Christiangramia aestuarii TaxID=1028746 RepID=A0A7K1LMI7_9FLAO|nr:DUF3703 domain-containing protein [Christiangramia aestuarii]